MDGWMDAPEHPPSWVDGADLDGVDTGSWGALGQDLMAKRVAYGSRLKAKRVPYGSRLKAKRVPYCRSAKWYPFSLQEGFSHDPHIGLRRPKGYHIALAQGQKGTIWWIYHMVPFWPSALQYGTLLAPPHIYIYIYMGKGEGKWGIGVGMAGIGVQGKIGVKGI